MREITKERANELMLETLVSKGAAKYATLTLPMTKEGIYLAQRKKEPHIGLYSMVGGKLEFTGPNSDIDRRSLIGKLQHEGYENLHESAVREFVEELFHKKDFRWIEDPLVESGEIRRSNALLSVEDIFQDTERMNTYTRPQLLKYFDPKRIHDALFDSTTGFVCAIYKAHVPSKSLPFKVLDRELGEPKLLKEITPDQVNYITRFVLYTAAKNNEAMRALIPESFQVEPTNITYAPLEYIVFPSDFEKAKRDSTPLSPSKKVNNSFYVNYPAK